jgi:MerC mercury resistance protein
VIKNWLDGLAISASAVCMIHCLALPLLVLLLPVLGLAIEHDEWVHVVILGFTAPVSIYALTTGAQTHGKRASLHLGFVGLGALSIGVWLESIVYVGTAITIIGSLSLAIAHWKNLRWRHDASL